MLILPSLLLSSCCKRVIYRSIEWGINIARYRNKMHFSTPSSLPTRPISASPPPNRRNMVLLFSWHSIFNPHPTSSGRMGRSRIFMRRAPHIARSRRRMQWKWSRKAGASGIDCRGGFIWGIRWFMRRGMRERWRCSGGSSRPRWRRLLMVLGLWRGDRKDYGN